MELTNIRLRSIAEFNPITRTLAQTGTLKYFRQPMHSEYPLDLRQGFDEYIFRNEVYPGEWDFFTNYVLKVDLSKQVVLETDFILHRRTILLLLWAQPKTIKLTAFRFMGCIFVEYVNLDDQNANLRATFAFKARQYMMTERHGEAPDTSKPIDERKQKYGMFTATLGQYRLLYSAELTGLSNTEPVGDLTKQEELDKCRLTIIRVVDQNSNFRYNMMKNRWVSQAYLGGADKLVFASTNKRGQVTGEIKVESVEALMQECKTDTCRRVERLHEFLKKISEKLQGVDGPHASISFHLVGDTINFDN